MSNITTIPLKKPTRDKLKQFGQKGDTYDDVIQKLISIAEQHDFYLKQKQILEEEEFTPIDGI